MQVIHHCTVEFWYVKARFCGAQKVSRVLCSPTEADLCCTMTPKCRGSEQQKCLSCSCHFPVVKILLLPGVLTQEARSPGKGDLKNPTLALKDFHRR